MCIAHVCKCNYIRFHTRACTCIYIQIYVCEICICLYVSIYIRLCVYVCIYIYIYNVALVYIYSYSSLLSSPLSLPSWRKNSLSNPPSVQYALHPHSPPPDPWSSDLSDCHVSFKVLSACLRYLFFQLSQTRPRTTVSDAFQNLVVFKRAWFCSMCSQHTRQKLHLCKLDAHARDLWW